MAVTEDTCSVGGNVGGGVSDDSWIVGGGNSDDSWVVGGGNSDDSWIVGGGNSDDSWVVGGASDDGLVVGVTALVVAAAYGHGTHSSSCEHF